jgi:hypothetical protein
VPRCFEGETTHVTLTNEHFLTIVQGGNKLSPMAVSCSAQLMIMMNIQREIKKQTVKGPREDVGQ